MEPLTPPPLPASLPEKVISTPVSLTPRKNMLSSDKSSSYEFLSDIGSVRKTQADSSSRAVSIYPGVHRSKGTGILGSGDIGPIGRMNVKSVGGSKMENGALELLLDDALILRPFLPVSDSNASCPLHTATVCDFETSSSRMQKNAGKQNFCGNSMQMN
ncbi:hypothetical protein G9A89_002286 [Geosiphon pyriformis]|nr:hypothetical protein G9A89_002286 [Geosiphon pyriformis]